MTVLILGGVREGRELAAQLQTVDCRVVTSLAGRVKTPALPVGEVRIGGFGGATGLASWLATNQVTCVVDATHPFAEKISANAAIACAERKIPLLRLQRPSWQDHPHADQWIWVDSHVEAATAASAYDKILLTVGRQRLADFAVLAQRSLWARMVELPDAALPESWVPLLDRGPFSVAGEVALFQKLGIDCLVTKDSGGKLTQAKLEAAAQCGVTVIVVRRAPLAEHVETVENLAAAVAWVQQKLS